jgi:hypothetical protein
MVPIQKQAVRSGRRVRTCLLKKLQTFGSLLGIRVRHGDADDTKL